MLDDQITNDYKEAMKSRNAVKSSTLSFLRAQVKNVVIDQRVDKATDEIIVTVIKKQIKQRQDSIEQYEKGGRADLADKEKQELAILKSYLPQEMSSDELKGIIAEAVREAGASSMKDMGKVMKAAMSKLAGRADNKTVSELIKEALSQ